VHDDNAWLSAADLLELNRDLQGSRAIRLLATTNLSLHACQPDRPTCVAARAAHQQWHRCCGSR
jgi:hypothetical protein